MTKTSDPWTLHQRCTIKFAIFKFSQLLWNLRKISKPFFVKFSVKVTTDSSTVIDCYCLTVLHIYCSVSRTTYNFHEISSEIFNEICSKISPLRIFHKKFICNLLSLDLLTSFTPNLPLSSYRQHLSYDVCLEVRGEIIRTVLCCIVYWSCAQS